MQLVVVLLGVGGRVVARPGRHLLQGFLIVVEIALDGVATERAPDLRPQLVGVGVVVLVVLGEGHQARGLRVVWRLKRAWAPAPLMYRALAKCSRFLVGTIRATWPAAGGDGWLAGVAALACEATRFVTFGVAVSASSMSSVPATSARARAPNQL